jgi:cellulose synthase (UDP-forming)
LASLYRRAAEWLEDQISRGDECAAGGRLLIDMVLQPLAHSHRLRADEIEAFTISDWPRIELEYRRLSTLFAVNFMSFERKRYENLSHESNKAMNLNSYLALLGGQFVEVERDGKLFLEPAHDRPATLVAPSAEFVVTLDADSLLLPDYAIRLVHKMRRPGNERVAVAQTPYSSIPAAPGSLEHIAGATTDIQYLIHQGFISFGATFWVGANALLRVDAPNDIKSHDHERGYPIVRYI